MLLAVEGGGFFSSSASGYTSGLALLFLGRKNEEKQMRVSPWNQYQLMEQETDPDLQLDTKNNGAPHRCTPFGCFNCVSSEVDGPSPPKVGPFYHSVTSPDTSSSDSDKHTINGPIDENKRKAHLKSSLKKPLTECSVIVEGEDGRDSLEEEHISITCCAERRKVHWTDACGRELTEIREFEPSDECTSDEEFAGGRARRCECVIQ